MIDPQKLLAMDPIETHHALTKRDCMLYALGIGESDLRYVFEENLQPFASMATVLAYPGFFWTDPKYGADWRQILHGEQSVTIHQPLPVDGAFVGLTCIEGIADKGPEKGAVVLASREIVGADGTVYATDRRTTFMRGDGGCGSAGAEIPRVEPVELSGPPDAVVQLSTRPEQALIYRLSGDSNPIHVDPQLAMKAGFDGPILHGLCTYGVACRAVTQALCGGIALQVRKLDVRFSGVVYPGETIETRIWRTGAGRAAFEAFVPERNVRVLSNGRVEFE